MRAHQDTEPSIPEAIRRQARELDECTRIQNALELTRYSQLADQDFCGLLTFTQCIGVMTFGDCDGEIADNGCICQECFDRYLALRNPAKWRVTELLATEFAIRYGLTPDWVVISQVMDS